MPNNVAYQMKVGDSHIAKIVKKVLHKQVENKLDITTLPQATGLVANKTPAVSVIGSIVTGVVQGTRVSDTIRTKRIGLKVVMQNGAVNLSQVARLMLIRDDANNGVNAITMAQLFNDTTADDAPNWGFNIDNRKRFKVLYDKTFVLQPHTATQATQKIIHINKRYKNGIEQIYNTGTAGTNADINVGAYYILFQTADNTTPPFLWYNWEQEYEDA